MPISRLSDGSRIPIEPWELARLDFPAWLDLEEPSPAEVEALGAVLGMHPLTLDDLREGNAALGFALQGETCALVLPVVMSGGPVFETLSLFWTKNWLVTVHRSQAPGPVRSLLEGGGGFKAGAKTPSWIAYRLAERGLDPYFGVIDALRGEVDDFEEGLLMRRPQDLRRIAAHRRRVAVVRRHFVPFGEALWDLLEEGAPCVEEAVRPFFRDLAHHADRLEARLDGLFKAVEAVVELDLSLRTERLNRAVERLTWVATILAPPTFVASIYGMNFRVMPELSWPWGYPWALFLMAASSVATLFVVRPGRLRRVREPERRVGKSDTSS